MTVFSVDTGGEQNPYVSPLYLRETRCLTMSRMHSSRKGKAGSKRPNVTKNPEWVTMSPDEIENLIVRFRKEGMSTSLIGLKLRDQYGVPDVKLATGKSIVKILEERGMRFDIPEDLANLLMRFTAVQTHLAANPRDIENRRGFTLLESKIRRLTKYYKKSGVLPQDWTPAVSIEAEK